MSYVNYGLTNLVASREVDIKGQDHMLAYITPEEGGLLQLMGGAGNPGPMGIPSFFDTGESDYDNQQSYRQEQLVIKNHLKLVEIIQNLV